MPVADADAASIDRLLAQLAEADNPDVAALVARYRAGSLTLAQLVRQAHAAIQQDADDDLDALAPGQRGGHHVLLYGVLFSTLAGLAMLSTPDLATAVGESSSRSALGAAAAEYGSEVAPAVLAEVARSLDERIAAVAGDLGAGSISGAQAAAYVESILFNDAWLSFGTEQNTQARDADETHAWWETDDPKDGCDVCQQREDDSPYEIDDLPGLPGDYSTPCGPGCVCSVRYGKAEKARPAALVKEAHCITCERWVGRNVNADATVYCPKCKETRIRA